MIQNNNSESTNTQSLQMAVSGSVLIAEFLEWKNRNEYYQVPNLYPITDFDTGWTECLPSEMEFDKRWDWLMPVLEKLCKTKIGDGITYVEYAIPRTFGAINLETGKFMVRLEGFCLHQEDTLIEATFLAIVEVLQFLSLTDR